MVKFTLSELAALVGGQLASEGDGSRVIRGASAIVEAGEGDVTFYGNPRYLALLRQCEGAAALVPLDFAEAVPPALIRVENPARAFAKVLEQFAPAPFQYPAGVHPTAVIGDGVQLGEGVSIQAYAVIEEGASIGAQTVIGAHGFVGREARVGEGCFFHARVTLGARCLVGDRVIIQSGAVIGSDGFGYEFANGRHVKIPQTGIVQIEDDVEIGANTTIDRARFGRTWVRRGTKIDNLVQVAHNVVIGEHCILVSQVGVSGSTRLGRYVTLAGQVGVVGHLEIGDRATVGAQGGVSKSLPAGGVYNGSPAVPAQEWREQVAQLRRMEKLISRVKRLEEQVGPGPV